VGCYGGGSWWLFSWCFQGQPCQGQGRTKIARGSKRHNKAAGQQRRKGPRTGLVGHPAQSVDRSSSVFFPSSLLSSFSFSLSLFPLPLPFSSSLLHSSPQYTSLPLFPLIALFVTLEYICTSHGSVRAAPRPQRQAGGERLPQ
jgi:hypothetical protein